MMAGAPVRRRSTATLQRPCAVTSAAMLRSSILQALDHGGVVVANLEQHFRASRNDARRAGIERDAAGGPYRARSAERGEAIVDGDAKPRQRQAGILANVHPGRAGVILLADKSDPVLPDADDGGDDADRKAAAFERLALLDMRLQISDVPPAFGLRARPAGKTHLAQRLPHGPAAAAVARGVDVRFGDAADIGPAAEEIAEMAFLVAPCRDFDGAADARVGIDARGRPPAHRRRRAAHRASPHNSGFRDASRPAVSARISRWCRAHCRCRRFQPQTRLGKPLAPATAASAYAASEKVGL